MAIKVYARLRKQGETEPTPGEGVDGTQAFFNLCSHMLDQACVPKEGATVEFAAISKVAGTPYQETTTVWVARPFWETMEGQLGIIRRVADKLVFSLDQNLQRVAATEKTYEAESRTVTEPGAAKFTVEYEEFFEPPPRGASVRFIAGPWKGLEGAYLGCAYGTTAHTVAFTIDEDMGQGWAFGWTRKPETELKVVYPGDEAAEHQRWVEALSAIAKEDEGLSDALERAIESVGRLSDVLRANEELSSALRKVQSKTYCGECGQRGDKHSPDCPVTKFGPVPKHEEKTWWAAVGFNVKSFGINHIHCGHMHETKEDAQSCMDKNPDRFSNLAEVLGPSTALWQTTDRMHR